MLKNNNKKSLLSYCSNFFIAFEFKTIEIFDYNLSRFYIVDF